MICDECETVAHCLKNGCVPKQPSKDQALKLALEALGKSDGFLYNWHENATDDEADAYATARQLNEKAITAIKQALAAPVQEQIAGFDVVLDERMPPNTMKFVQPAPVQPVASYKGPEELWLQLHGDCSDDELTEPVDYTDDSVTWCWHQIYDSDVRYVREDTAARRQWVGTVDCIGLALDLEVQAKRVESQTIERAMLAAANGLRIIDEESKA
jgi:hypothetical protein